MSQCFVPNWNLRHQRQEQVEGVERNRSSHVHTHQANHLDPMSNYEVTELTWENGQLAMHALGGLVPTTPTKPQWAQAGETLESIVHQATYHKQNLDLVDYLCNPANIDSVVASSGGKWAENSGEVQTGSGSTKKRSRSESGPYQRDYSIDIPTEHPDPSACASASATFYRKADTTMMTWTSLESPRSLKRKPKTTNEDAACHERQENMDEEQETKTETGRSHSTRRSRAAAVHNQSERRRRDRINQKMKALQKLVPNSSKTDKASMLDEVIEYLKQLQAQVQIMSVRNMPQMMMPIGMQQHLQMSLLARMGMGLGMGMGVLDMNSLARSTPQPIPPLMHPNSLPPASQRFVPPFVMPSMMPTHTTSPANPDPGTNPSIPIHDPYYALMMQSMNIDLYNKMAAFYRQNVDQTAQAMSCPSQSNPVQRD